MRTLIFLSLITIIFFACTNPRDKALDNIEKTELALADTTKIELDEALVKRAVLQYEDFAKAFPDDTLAPQFLYKAGEFYGIIGEHKKSLATYKRVYKEYKDFKKAPQCLFLQGFIYDDKMKDFNTSTRIYNQFLELYPQHELAESVKFLLENLGKSDEQIIRELEAKRAVLDSLNSLKMDTLQVDTTTYEVL